MENYSNCLFFVLGQKIRYGKNIKIICIKPRQNEVPCYHFMAHDLRDNNIYDWYQKYALKHWYDWVFHKGNVRCRPFSVYERWLKSGSWSK